MCSSGVEPEDTTHGKPMWYKYHDELTTSVSKMVRSTDLRIRAYKRVLLQLRHKRPADKEDGDYYEGVADVVDHGRVHAIWTWTVDRGVPECRACSASSGPTSPCLSPDTTDAMSVAFAVGSPRHTSLIASMLVDPCTGADLSIFSLWHTDLFLWQALHHTICVSAWSSPQTRTYLIPKVLASMDSLRSLSFPSFYIHTVHHHSSTSSLSTLIRLRTRLSLFPMPPLLSLPSTSTPTQHLFTHTSATLLPNLVNLHGPPHLIFPLAPSRPLIDMWITVSILSEQFQRSLGLAVLKGDKTIV
ncbi:uncharacterized protein BT62DRAFT_1013390 [Guyanagaster necrorhizus]|uniref:Uncharacterized protein n=1 Tax=Guyanagaster necrorhizus TaxID=856835 RepID=A0A9P7VFY0_9AGAR|nr:uncharacterized protein BT62DRAFT_1013390 [Guyanagaster necrorhizus MCA 3950]KAG7439847.1 hypothetical protein BT62DRAFT_1013390 [Guyanagaster necrorhizus MCA 3950]